MKYDYMKAMVKDIEDYIKSDIETTDFENEREFEEYLNDELWAKDSVTGNASGSYTFNTYEAEENLCHNFDLIEAAYGEFGGFPDYYNPEAIDVTIRCYLLPNAIHEVLKENENEYIYNEDFEDEEEEIL